MELKVTLSTVPRAYKCTFYKGGTTTKLNNQITKKKIVEALILKIKQKTETKD